MSDHSGALHASRAVIPSARVATAALALFAAGLLGCGGAVEPRCEGQRGLVLSPSGVDLVTAHAKGDCTIASVGSTLAIGTMTGDVGSRCEIQIGWKQSENKLGICIVPLERTSRCEQITVTISESRCAAASADFDK